MATITNLTSGIEVNYGGAVTYIKHGKHGNGKRRRGGGTATAQTPNVLNDNARAHVDHKTAKDCSHLIGATTT